MRTASRRAPTYYSRLVPAAGLLLAAVIAYSDTFWGYRTSLAEIGRYMFIALHGTLFSLIWLLVPLATADVISRERREDTLGLLLLTPLRAFEVVVAKLISSLLGSLGLLAAAVPVIVLPLLIGGVTPADLVRATLINLAAVIGAVTAGIITSSLSQRRGRAWLASLVVGAGWGTLIFAAHAWVLVGSFMWAANDYDLWNEFWRMPGFLVLIAPLVSWFGAVAGDELFRSANAGHPWLPAVAAAVTLFFALVLAWVGILFASWRVVRLVSGAPTARAQSAASRTLTREVVFKQQLKRRRNRLLDRNPIAWQQGRRWDARLAKWGWLLLATVTLTFASFDEGWDFLETMMMTIFWLGLFMLISQLLVSVISLHSERDTGALELLLVTTLTPRALFMGRVSGIRWAFGPAAILLGTGWLVSGLNQIQTAGYRSWDPGLPWQPMICVLISFALLAWCLPMIGVCFSLSRPGVISGTFNALFFAVILPWMGTPAFFGIGYMLHHELVQPGQLRVWPLWLELLLWTGTTGLVQGMFWLAARKGKLEGYPRVLPDWFIRCRLGWILPWAVPTGVMLALTLGGMDLLYRVSTNDWWVFLAWQAAAWLVLIFFARCCQRATIRQLEERTFS